MQHFECILQDILEPLSRLSLKLQQENIGLGEVQDWFEMALEELDLIGSRLV